MLPVIWWNRTLNEQLLKEDEVDRQDLGWLILAITVEQNSIGYSVIQNWQEFGCEIYYQGINVGAGSQPSSKWVTSKSTQKYMILT